MFFKQFLNKIVMSDGEKITSFFDSTRIKANYSKKILKAKIQLLQLLFFIIIIICKLALLLLSVSGVGELSLWEFSGHEPYYLVYDRFLGNNHCLHAIVFSLSETFDVQMQQVMFWLSFLQARMSPQEPLGELSVLICLPN